MTHVEPVNDISTEVETSKDLLADVRFLVGNELILRRRLRTRAFDSVVCDFLDEVSCYLRKDSEAKSYADVQAVAFWCRKANISKLSKEYAVSPGRIRMGRGLVFHVTPSNVPVNFAFSFFFSLLAGNSNLVRVPSKDFPQIEIICRAIDEVASQSKFSNILRGNAFVRYDSGLEATKIFSGVSSARMIWGGDETVKKVRSMPSDSRCVDLVFADRHAIAVFDSTALSRLTDREMQILSEKFYNDTLLMHQNACSSPQLVVWLGTRDREAEKRFWDKFESVVLSKYELAHVHSVDKLLQTCLDAMDLEAGRLLSPVGSPLTRISIPDLSIQPGPMERASRFGFFYEFETNDAKDLFPVLNRKCQTVLSFGHDQQTLAERLLKTGCEGVDRVVPVGRALDMGPVWDGYDIIRSLSREVEAC